jgi:hypothetical protein
MRSSARYRFMSIATRGEKGSRKGTLRARLIHTVHIYLPLELERRVDKYSRCQLQVGQTPGFDNKRLERKLVLGP